MSATRLSPTMSAMSPVLTPDDPTKEAGATSSNPPVDFSDFQLLHDVFKIRSADPIQVPLLAFPRSRADDFEYFTADVLERFTSSAAWCYAHANLSTVCPINTCPTHCITFASKNFGVLVRPTAQRNCAHSHSSVLLQTPARTVALLGPTNLDWIVSAFGLSKCGFTVLALSPRLSYQAMVKLMQETDCHCLVYYPSPQLRPVVDQVQLAMDVTLLSMMPRSDYDVPTDKLRPFVREFDILEEKKRYAAIVHSSGSTGLPKPIYYQHTKFTQPYQVGVGDRHLFTLPLSVKPALPSVQNLCETSLTSVGTLDTTHSPSQSLSPTCISARRSSS